MVRGLNYPVTFLMQLFRRLCSIELAVIPADAVNCGFFQPWRANLHIQHRVGRSNTRPHCVSAGCSHS